jgi:hypothetical protein
MYTINLSQLLLTWYGTVHAAGKQLVLLPKVSAEYIPRESGFTVQDL